MRIALVKSEFYPDLYTKTNTCSPQEIIFSSSMRSGPVSLFTEFETDFFILKADKFSNNITWREKIDHCKQGTYESYLKIAQKEYSIGGEKFSNTMSAISANEINWSNYDIVICLDACINSSICLLHKEVTWCYYISEGCMPEYKNSRLRPLTGYKFFLNQRFRYESDYIQDPNLEHEIDFPYHLNSPHSMKKLLGDQAFSDKRGIFVDRDTRRLLTEKNIKSLESFGPVRFTAGSIEVVLRALASSKYYLRLGSKPVWGNASIEAAACNTLQIGSARGFRNRIFCMPENSTQQVEFNDLQFQQAIDLIEKFESNGDAYCDISAKLGKLCKDICFFKPTSRLIKIRSM